MAYTTVSLAQLQADMEPRWDGSVFWTPEEARLAINEALREWNLLVGRWRAAITVSSGAGQHEYALPLATALTYNMRVRMTTGLPLIPASIIGLDLGRPSWRLETTATGGDVPTVPTIWAPVSLQRFAIWPATVGAGVANILIEGVARTPVLLDGADTIDLGEELHDLILDYALHAIAFKEGGARWRATLAYFYMFLAAAAEENGLLKASQAYRRAAGLDRTRDYKKVKGEPTGLDPIVQALDERRTS